MRVASWWQSIPTSPPNNPTNPIPPKEQNLPKTPTASPFKLRQTIPKSGSTQLMWLFFGFWMDKFFTADIIYNVNN